MRAPTLGQGYTNPGYHVARATEFSTVVPHVWVISTEIGLRHSFDVKN
jgi:hypothetical protein